MKLGVCYYPEQWPSEMWFDDAQKMIGMGIEYVRIGEFAWSRFEPSPGVYQWEWFDQVIEILSSVGLKLVLGTPTATPPKWLVDQYPEILAVDENNQIRHFGSRRHYCFSSDVYRQHSSRITQIMAERYGRHKAIAAWQIDNEYGCHDTIISYSDAARQAFRQWLKNRYNTIDRLNHAWGTVFWSQEYQNFEQIDPPLLTVTEANPSHRLDYYRFSSDMVVDFNQVQVDILRRLSPDKELLHNYMGFFTDFNHFDVAESLDIATWDSYPLGFLDQGWFSEAEKSAFLRVGHPDFAAFHHDLYRAVGRNRLWVMEQQPGPVNWAPNNIAPAKGVVRLWTWESFAHGAEVVSYFRWRQAPFAQEQMHAGLHLVNGQEDIACDEVRQVQQELKQLGGSLSQQTHTAELALVFDYESQWLLSIQPQGEKTHYLQIVYEFYSSLRELGLSIDIISPHDRFDQYNALVIPTLPIISDEFVKRLEKFSGQILMGPRTGSKTIDYHIPSNLPPGNLQSLIELNVTRVESLRENIHEPVFDGKKYIGNVNRWRDLINTEIEASLQYADGYGFLYHHNNLHYFTGWPDRSLRKILLKYFLRSLSFDLYSLSDGLRLRQHGNYLFAFNYGQSEQMFSLESAQLILGDTKILPTEIAIWQL